jgi:hypothetical protein
MNIMDKKISVILKTDLEKRIRLQMVEREARRYPGARSRAAARERMRKLFDESPPAHPQTNGNSFLTLECSEVLMSCKEVL